MHKLLLFFPLLLACNPFIRSDEKESNATDSLVSTDSLPTIPEAELIKPGIYFYYLMDDHYANNIEESDQKMWLEGKIEQLQVHDYSGELTRNSGTATLGAHKDPYADLFVLVAFSGNADPDSIHVKLNDLENPSLNWQNRQLGNGQVLWILRWPKEAYYKHLRPIKDQDIPKLYSPEKLQSYQSTGKDTEHNLKSGQIINMKIQSPFEQFSAYWHIVFDNTRRSSVNQ